jgi:hypothetical protein
MAHGLCADLVQWIANMKHPTVQVLQTRRLISDIRRVVEILSVDIAQEENVTGFSDPKLPEYSMVARALSARRVNLECTLAALERRLVE